MDGYGCLRLRNGRSRGAESTMALLRAGGSLTVGELTLNTDAAISKDGQRGLGFMERPWLWAVGA